MQRGPIIMMIAIVASFLLTSCRQEPAIIQMKETTGDSGETSVAMSKENPQLADEVKLQTAGGENLQEVGETNQNGATIVAEAKIFVHVCGAVVNPGVYEMSSDSRIFEAIEMAGGFTEEAHQSSVNLADKVADGQQLIVPTQEEVATAPNQVMAIPRDLGNPSESVTLINVNTADSTLLQELNGIGEAKAKEILAYRDKNGRFDNIEDIKNVNGIGDKLYERIKENITVN